MAQLQETTVDGTVVALRSENTTTSSKSLALADRDKVVACTNTGSINITIPSDSTAFPIGSIVYIARLGTGSVTIAAAGGVTLSKTGNLAEGEEIYCRKRSSNNWVVVETPTSFTGTGGTVVNTGNARTHTYTSGSSTFVVG